MCPNPCITCAQEKTWTEVARRLLVLFSNGLRVKLAESSGGVASSHPLMRLDFLAVLQHLAAGVPADPGAGVAKLPFHASKSAPNALMGLQVRLPRSLPQM